MSFSLVSSVLRCTHRLSLLGETNRLIAFYCTAPELKDKIDKMIKSNKVVVFMKGTPGAPRCGFSNAVTQVIIASQMLVSLIKSFNCSDPANAWRSV